MKNDFIKKKIDNNKPLPKKAKKMSLSQVITLLLMIFWSITSILTLVLTFKSCSEENVSLHNVAYAEEFKPYSDIGDVVYNDYSFYGNDLFYLSAYRYNTDGQWSGVDFIRFNVNFMSTYDTTRSQYKTYAYINANKYDETNNSQILSAVTLNAYFVNEQLVEDRTLYANGNLVFNLRANNSSVNYPLLYYMSGDFNSNVKFIQIGSTQTYIDVYPTNPNLPLPNLGIGNINLKNVYTYVRYIDNNGNSVTFSFPSSSNSTLNNRTYVVGELEENASYILGKEEGKEEGKRIGFDEGFEKGYDQGKIEGKALGKQEGIESANNYTFFTLISSVIDAPIQAFRGLLSFEILGYNMADLLLSLFTLSIIIVLIKLFI